MFSKNQVIVFVVSFLIVGFFLLSAADEGFSQNGSLGCCADPSDGCDISFESVCDASEGVWCEGGTCEESGLCRCPAVPVPQIPTLNQWGKIIMAGVIGSFAVICLLLVRRVNEGGLLISANSTLINGGIEYGTTNSSNSYPNRVGNDYHGGSNGYYWYAGTMASFKKSL